MTTRYVTNGNDDGIGSLRYTINNALPGDTISINFSDSNIITLSSTLEINKDLTITSPTNASIIKDSSLIFRVINFPISDDPKTITLYNLTISGGNVSSSGGGFGNSTSILTFNNCIISNNNANLNGGGIFNDAGTITLNYCTISDNISRYSGGSIYNISGTINLNNCAIHNNTAGTTGGAISNFTGGIINLNSCAIYNNTATALGGGIINFQGGIVNLNNCTVSTNSTNNGGGIYNFSTLNLNNCTVSNNTADAADATSGIFNDGICTIVNTIVAANFNNTDVDGEFISLGNNLIGNSTNSSGFSNGVMNDIVGTATTPIDPQLGSLQDNGGPTLTMMPELSSPAINNGNNILAPGPYDQRGIGYPRIRGGTVDIGAVENQFVCFTGDSLVLVKDATTNIISQIKTSDVKSGIHHVYNTVDKSFVPVKLNIVTGPCNMIMLLKKDMINSDKPDKDLYITSGHVILINGHETKVRNIKGATKVKIESQLLYSICTDKRIPIIVNNLEVIAYGYDEWINYSKNKNITWYDN